MREAALAILAAVLIFLTGCGSVGDTTSNPRKVVLNMIRAMEKSDTKAIGHYLDFKALMTPGDTDYALQMDTVRVFTDIEKVVADLTEGGLTHTRWMAMQRIVGTSTQLGDSAEVEVSFISQETNKQFYNKWGLHRVNDRWKIYSFHLLKGDK